MTKGILEETWKTTAVQASPSTPFTSKQTQNWQLTRTNTRTGTHHWHQRWISSGSNFGCGFGAEIRSPAKHHEHTHIYIYIQKMYNIYIYIYYVCVCLCVFFSKNCARAVSLMSLQVRLAGRIARTCCKLAHSLCILHNDKNMSNQDNQVITIYNSKIFKALRNRTGQAWHENPADNFPAIHVIAEFDGT